jgi:hypothetical protein
MADRRASLHKPRRRRLRKSEQDAILELLFKGWGKIRACRELGLSYESLIRTVEERTEFGERVLEASKGKNEAIEMALYKAALEGNVTAQRFWLQHQTDPEQPLAEKQLDVLSEEDDLSTLSDEELIERARTVGIDLPPKIAQRLAKAYRRGRSGDVPPAADN